MLMAAEAPLARSTVSLAWALAAMATATELTVSGNLLTWFGDPYVTDGGSILFKIHPASYLAAAAALARACEGGRPISTAWRIFWREPCVAVFLACTVFCILYAAIMTGCCTLVVFFDTFLPAGFLAVALHDASAQERRWLLRLVQVGFGVNAALGLVEAVAQVNWVPLYLNSAEYAAIAAEFRPTALYDHPLTGGILTMIGLLLPIGRPGSRVLRVCYLALLSAGLIAFGGRTAAGLTLLVVLARWCPSLMRAVLDQRVIPRSAIIAVGVALTALPCLLLAAEATGFGGRLLGHLYWDDSAQVRLRQWHVLDLLSTTQIVFGSTRPDLMGLLVPLKLQWGVGVIENFWLLMFINLGLIGFPVFVSGMAGLFVWCGRQAQDAAPFLVTSFILAASSSNSLARKSNILILLVAAVVAAAGNVRHGRRASGQISFRSASRGWAADGVSAARRGALV